MVLRGLATQDQALYPGSVQITFKQSPDWIIEADLGPKFPGFNQALYDAVSTIPPRGSSDDCPSSYWIDRALESLTRQPQDPARPFLEGNTTALYTDGRVVRAHSLYELFEDEVISLPDFADVLQQWREAVRTAGRNGRCGKARERYERLPPPALRRSAC